MKRSVTALAALALAFSLAGCGLFSDKGDPRKDWQAAEYYNAAKEEFDNHNWDSAIKLYEALEAKYPFGRFAQQAQIEVAYAYYKQGETASAITALEKFIKLHPNHQNLDYALYLKALVNFREDLGPLTRLPGMQQDLADRDPKAARESFESFKELVNRFPESRYVARERMAYLVEALARHEINVARYYMARGAYLAAVNRAQDALTKFPNSPAQHREALDIMVESYDRMGLTELREDTRKVIARNFPADPKAHKPSGRTASGSWWKFW